MTKCWKCGGSSCHEEIYCDYCGAKLESRFELSSYLKENYPLFALIGVFSAISFVFIGLSSQLYEKNNNFLLSIKNTSIITFKLLSEIPQIPIIHDSTTIIENNPSIIPYSITFFCNLIVLGLILIIVNDVRKKIDLDDISDRRQFLFFVLIIGFFWAFLIYTIWLFQDTILIILFFAIALIIGLAYSFWARFLRTNQEISKKYKISYKILTIYDTFLLIYILMFQIIHTLFELFAFTFLFVGFCVGILLFFIILFLPFKK